LEGAAAGAGTPPADLDGRPPPDAGRLEQVAALLHRSERPLIVAGGGVLQSAAWAELAELAERLDAPVLLTANGKGALSARHRLAFENAAAGDLLDGADTILAVGTRFASPGGWRWRLGPEQRLLRIDADAEELTRDIVPEVAV